MMQGIRAGAGSRERGRPDRSGPRIRDVFARAGPQRSRGRLDEFGVGMADSLDGMRGDRPRPLDFAVAVSDD